MSSTPPISVCSLTCRYGEHVALDSVSMTLEAGEILGVTGASGAGMSTLIKAILLLVAPQAGRVMIDGGHHELASSRARIAYLPQTVRPPGHLTGHDFIAMARTVQPGIGDAVDLEALIADVDLMPDLLNHPIRRYAKDDVQKLALIATFATNRPILLLDQPMSYLEPAAQAGLRHRLKRHAQAGGAVMISSHRADDHHDVVDRLVMLKDGRLIETEPLSLADAGHGMLDRRDGAFARRPGDPIGRKAAGR